MRWLRCLQQGFQILELVIVMAVMMAVAFVTTPPLLRITGDLRIRLAAQEVVGVLRTARAFAVRHGAHVAVRFRTARDGTVTYAIYRDGDGDGVLSRDIDTRIDPEVAPPRRLDQTGHRVQLGFPVGRRLRDPGSPQYWLQTNDPIRFSADMASFGPLGTSTPGSLYLTDGASRVAVVRILGRTGRVRVMAYDFDRHLWK